MKYHLLFPIQRLRRINRLSERALASVAGISRRSLQQVIQAESNITLRSIVALSSALGRRVEIVVAPQEVLSEFCTVALALKVERDGFESWKLHYMELVDEFRRSIDPRLVMLPPHRRFDPRLTALLASLVTELCCEVGLPVPDWAGRRYFLDTPWFVSGIDSLKASALLESPIAFRNNNIFVHNNFTARA